MNKKHFIILIIVILLFLFTLLGYSYLITEKATNTTTLTVYAQSSASVEEIVNEINTSQNFVGHNKDTLDWFSTLTGKKVFFGYDYYVVMNENDAKKLPLEFVTDVSMEDTFSCEIIEKRSLGSDYNDVIYVKNVELISQNIEYYDV